MLLLTVHCSCISVALQLYCSCIEVQVAVNLCHFCPTARTEQILDVEVAVCSLSYCKVQLVSNLPISVSAAQPHPYLKYEPVNMDPSQPDLLSHCKLEPRIRKYDSETIHSVPTRKSRLLGHPEVIFEWPRGLFCSRMRVGMVLPKLFTYVQIGFYSVPWCSYMLSNAQTCATCPHAHPQWIAVMPPPATLRRCSFKAWCMACAAETVMTGLL